MKKIEELEKKLGSLKPDSPEIEEVDKEMRETVAERDRLKKMIDGAKGS